MPKVRRGGQRRRKTPAQMRASLTHKKKMSASLPGGVGRLQRDQMKSLLVAAPQPQRNRGHLRAKKRAATRDFFVDVTHRGEGWRQIEAATSLTRENLTTARRINAQRSANARARLAAE